MGIANLVAVTMGGSMMFRSLPFLKMIAEATFKRPFFINFSKASTISFQWRWLTSFDKNFSPASNSRAVPKIGFSIMNFTISTVGLAWRSKFLENRTMFSKIFQERVSMPLKRCSITFRNRSSSIDRSICSTEDKNVTLN